LELIAFVLLETPLRLTFIEIFDHERAAVKAKDPTAVRTMEIWARVSVGRISVY